ncbi:MAG: hypothetical protein IJD40_15610 [Lachnospiraceae bacterium]|nr:hypothetical protein [Lachnospiraceae bacterium]
MLKGNNNSQLVQIGVKEKVCFFYQIWQELVTPQTLVVYQYRVLTSLSALEELIKVIEKTLEGLFNSDANIEACREETLYILNKDIIMKKYYGAVCNRLRSSLGNKPKTDADKRRLKYQLTYMVHEIKETYLKNLLQELKKNIQEGSEEAIELNTNSVVSQAINNGWSAQALFDLLRFFRNDKEFEQQWESFSTALINTEKVRHEVLINIPFKRQEVEEQNKAVETLQKLGLGIETYAVLVSAFRDIEDIGRLLKAEKRYFHISVNAYDVYTAAHIAVSEIAEKLNMASFYNLVSAWDLSSVIIVSINGISKYHKSFPAEQLYQTYDYIESSGRVFDNTINIFLDENKKEIREKLQGSFSYTNISRASLFQEEKYMNLWVALESLARTDIYNDIITNIKATVPAAVSLRYVYRILRNYVEDCNRCQVSLEFSTCSMDTRQESKQKMVREAIEVFCDDDLYMELLQKCQVSSLLKYRTESIHAMLRNTSILKDKVKNHFRRVEWQIQRLYRIRNEIAHAALQEKTSLLVYIEHLYDYLTVYITEIVTCLCEKQTDSIEEALCLIKDNYEVFIAFVENEEEHILKRTVLKTGVIDMITE